MFVNNMTDFKNKNKKKKKAANCDLLFIVLLIGKIMKSFLILLLCQRGQQSTK